MTEKKIFLMGRWGTLKSEIQKLIPNAEIEWDDDTEEIIIRTGIIESSDEYPKFMEEAPDDYPTDAYRRQPDQME